jgi:hypothetical protein
MTAQEYWDREGARLLAEGNRIPTVQERVLAAWRDGFGEGALHSANFEADLERERRDCFLERARLNSEIEELKRRVAGLKAALAKHEAP